MTKLTLEQMYTALAHDEFDERHYGAIQIPVYQNSLFAFDTYQQFEHAFEEMLGNHIYSRGNNPTVEFLEGKLAMLEGAEAARCFASGMAAISAAIFSSVRAGDHIVCVSNAYGPAKQVMGEYLKRFGVETSFVEGSRFEAVQEAVRPNTKLIYLESPSSQMFELIDLKQCADLAKGIGARTIIDNTWATPIFQNPLEFGIDLVVHSITKYIAGHSDALGGVVMGASELMKPLSYDEYMLFGGIMTAHTAAMVLRGLRTLPVRMERCQASGLKVANWLETSSFVERVYHPGLPSHPQHELAKKQLKGYSSLFSFESKQPIERLKAWASKLKLFKIAVSWGGYESLVTVGRNTDVSSGEVKTVVRLYIGLESPDDLIRDMQETWQEVAASASLDRV
ncbi:PLP-dependent aspartate aminotransferase family protein [Paenibacillus sp. OV219]|uniref:trans-sulfuration enzyme family protein n=1 Tax=Paenibacillus sp. OV219 TaxID=1884377 RepID=UPI0008AD08CE|nr:PLP-dependent aspartate aminotransferase family protein [Paenibacillus sp. OV219]SEM56995.1 Cystathionine beta-lyase/cystathionine gamma-synthase [Paenibacillus sp. OV219]